MSETVVITGASAGIGRATARAYAARGANVVLVARGHAGLRAVAEEVTALGGHPLVRTADTAEPEQLEAAARAAEETFGPLDVWVNCAFTNVFAPFEEIGAEEYARVTRVTYLGFVNGTRTALRRMLPRDHGTIVQVGSALGERAVPLQSAYCGAKHAVNGFTSAVRTELLHRGSNVHVTIAQMPAVNTPQFSWVRSRLPRHPRPVPPIHQPEAAARGVLHAADHPHRKQHYVGASTVATVWAQRLAPALLDRYLARTGTDAQQTDDRKRSDQDNLFTPADHAPGTDHGAHGIFDTTSRLPSTAETLLTRHPTAAAVTALGAAAATAASVRRRGRRRR